MHVTALAIRRPIFILMVIGALLVIGLVSWPRLGVDLLPALDFPVVVVTTSLPGASPDTVDTLVTRKVEDAVSGVNDVDYIQSTSIEGVSTVIVFFTDRAPRDIAGTVERRVNAVRDQLPVDARAPTVAGFDPNADPILSLAVRGKGDVATLQQLVQDRIQKRLQTVSGVAQVSLIGGLEREVQVQVDQYKLQARGLSILQVNAALAADNLDVPAGTISQNGRERSVRLDSQVQTPGDLGKVLVARSPGGPVYLRDVATVVDSFKRPTQLQRLNGTPAVGINIVKQSSANTVDTADGVKQALQDLQKDLPSDVSVEIATDQSTFTRNSVHDVQVELQLAIVLTGLVLLVFLHTLRSTVIVLLAIPTSLIATLGVMYFLGIGLNMMSLMGLTLTVGILVDDSIVVLENIFRHLQMGEGPREAAISGRGEIGFAAIAITLVDVVVFTPIAFMSGVLGQLFRQFGLVIAAATLFSLFISFTLTPMLASRWYGAGEQSPAGRRAPSRNPLTRSGQAWDAGYARLEAGYARLLERAIGRRARWLVVLAGLLSLIAGLSLVASGVLSSESVPDTDNGQFVVTVQTPPGSALEATDAATHTIEQRLQAWPEVRNVFTSVGLARGGGLSANRARFATLQVSLVDKRQRTRTTQQLVMAARGLGTDLPGVLVTALPQDLFGGSGAAIQLRVQGDDQDVLAALARQVAEVVRRTPGTADVDDGAGAPEPEVLVQVDRERASDVGVSPGQMAAVLRAGLAGTVVSTFQPTGTSGWDVTVTLPDEDRQRAEQLDNLPIVTPEGASVRLGQAATFAAAESPAEIQRQDNRRTLFVTADLAGRPLGDVAKDIQTGLARLSIPAGYSVSQDGDAKQQSEQFAQIGAALGLSVLLMYMLMAALFESLLFPLVIMLSLPLAIVGAFGALALTGHTLNIMSMIGLILLTGLVGKNAILLVDYTNTLRRRGVARDEALLQAGPARLRPILMTTAALVLAMLPVALQLGEGGEFRSPMAVTVIGGLLTSTLLTLVLIPAVYTLADDAQRSVARLLAGLRLRSWRSKKQVVVPHFGNSVAEANRG
jgi:HAE1 family hydrophobic/amphiphilic exporter-1